MTPAGFWVRLMAYNIDFVFMLLVALVLRVSIDEPLMMYVALFLCYVLYEVVFISSKWGATPGKKYMRLSVCDDGGRRNLPILRVFIRTLLKLISLLLLFGGFAMIAWRRDHRALHDLGSGSVVVLD